MRFSKLTATLGVSAGLLIGAGLNPKFEPAKKLLEEKLKTAFEIVKTEPISKTLSVMVVESRGERGMFIVENNTQRVLSVGGLVHEPDLKNIEMLRRLESEITAYNSSKKDNAILEGIKRNKGISISLNSDKKGETTYMLLDPMCPYCKDKVDSINEEIQKGRVEVIIVGFLGGEAVRRANYFYNNIQNAKDDQQKIEVLKKTFNKNTRIGDEKENKVAKQATKTAEEAGIEAVPYSFVR